MNMHENARLTPKGREILVHRLGRGEHPSDVASAMGVSTGTVYKWRRRYREQGLAGLQDRSSRPANSPARTPADTEARVVQLRRERRTMDRIAQETGVSRATVGRILARHGLNRWRDLEPSEPVVRYERDRPGELIHIDIKNWGNSPAPVTASLATGMARAMRAASGGSSYMSASTIIHALGSARSWPLNARKMPQPSSKRLSPGMASLASRWNV